MNDTAPPANPLRERTAPLHARLDGSMSRHDLSEPRGYGDFLRVMAAGFAPVENWLADNHAAAPPGLGLAPRAALARADLAALRGDMPDADPVERFAPPAGAARVGTPEWLGVLYVLEGSRLGAKLIRKRVAAGLPTQFLDDSEPPIAWRSLLQLLDQLPPQELDRAALAASTTFEHFLRVASRC